MNTAHNPLTMEKAQKMLAAALDKFYASEMGKNYSHKFNSTCKIEIVLNHRMFSSAGRARMKTPCFGPMQTFVILNVRLLERCTDEQQQEVVSHEAAHCADFFIRKKSDHKGFWRTIHRAMGGTGETCHQFDTTGLERTQPYHYVKNPKGVIFKVKTCFANRIKEGRYKGYEYIGLVQHTQVVKPMYMEALGI